MERGVCSDHIHVFKEIWMVVKQLFNLKSRKGNLTKLELLNKLLLKPWSNSPNISSSVVVPIADQTFLITKAILKLGVKFQMPRNAIFR